MSSALGRQAGKLTAMCLLGAMVMLSRAGVARAAVAETEVREFSISIDGKAYGSYRMTISRHDDGKVSMTGEANLTVKKLLITVYRYSYNGTEWWQEGKDSRLLRLDSTSNDNGNQY